MARRIQQYDSESLTVTFDPNLCIHAARCLQGEPNVFDVRRRKWIELELGETDSIAETVERCPSGALQFQRKDGGSAEVPASPPFAIPAPNGPVFIRGDLQILDAEGGVLATGTRFALCRCGQSNNKPFCDNTHRTTGFRAP